MEEKIRYIEQEIKNTGLAVTLAQAEQFYRYYEILLEWNAFMNLTAITDFPDVVKKHFVDSLLIIQVKNMEDVDNLIDLGTGAGFPGVPLKIMFPHLKVTFLDSLRKRIDFLNHVVERLDLCELETVHGRAEDFAKPGVKREKYDLCVSRAVADLAVLSEYCLPYVRVGGEFISYKAGEIDEEVKRAKSAVFLLGGKMEQCRSFLLPGTDITRSLVCIRKVNGCPKKYPRKASINPDTRLESYVSTV